MAVIPVCAGMTLHKGSKGVLQTGLEQGARVGLGHFDGIAANAGIL